MIFKSYILEQNIQSISKYKIFLFYGENQGLKKEFKEKIKFHNKEKEILNLIQDEIIKNKDILTNEIKIQNKISFFRNNNVVVLLSKSKKTVLEKKHEQDNFFYGPIRIKKFVEKTKAIFHSKNLILQDIKILDDNLINLKSRLSCPITLLEKKILIEFVKNKKIKREFFFEKIFQIKKDIETKTLESHFTRIRKKLSKIDSKIRISSKEDTFFLEG